jgi:hypothetical protein
MLIRPQEMVNKVLHHHGFAHAGVEAGQMITPRKPTIVHNFQSLG